MKSPRSCWAGDVVVGARPERGFGEDGACDVVDDPFAQVLVHHPVHAGENRVRTCVAVDPKSGYALAKAFRGRPSIVISPMKEGSSRMASYSPGARLFRDGCRLGDLHELAAVDAVARVVDRGIYAERTEKSLHGVSEVRNRRSGRSGYTVTGSRSTGRCWPRDRSSCCRTIRCSRD